MLLVGSEQRFDSSRLVYFRFYQSPQRFDAEINRQAGYDDRIHLPHLNSKRCHRASSSLRTSSQCVGKTVRKVKIFKGVESELHPLEDEINQWLADAGATLISVTGNIAPQTNTGSSMGTFSASDVLIIVVYEV